MRRIKALIILLVLINCHVYSQDKTVNHIVDRGETLASIANLYGVTTGKIIELNPEASDFVYTGMELIVPHNVIEVAPNASPSLVSEAVRNRAIIAEACEDADRLLSQEEYTKAVKAYSKIIKKFKNSTYSCVEAYYGRALAYYNQGKWKRSIKDFERTIDDPRCGSTVRSHCTSLLATAREYRQQQLERKAELWGSIISATLVTTTSAIVANQQAKNSAKNINTTRGTASLNNSSASSANNSSDEQSYNSSGSSTKSNVCPSLKAAGGKWYCANTGRCGMCNGDGRMDGSFGQGANAHKCTLCNGTGKCKYCQ